MIQIDMFTRAIHDTRIFLASDVSVVQINDTLSEARFRGFVVHFNKFFKTEILMENLVNYEQLKINLNSVLLSQGIRVQHSLIHRHNEQLITLLSQF